MKISNAEKLLKTFQYLSVTGLFGTVLALSASNR